jgi:hypothetical protein
MSASINAPRCALCNEVLGVYESIVLIGRDGEPERTTRAAGELPDGRTAVHEECYSRPIVAAEAVG